MRILIILKKRQDYNCEQYTPVGLSTGLYNSASFIEEMLREHGVHVHLVVVTDNNDIDREVFKYRPTHVIIEALWVVPEKFRVLHRLHPKVKWIVRLHSNLPFLANEGSAIKWIREYVKLPMVHIAFNSLKIYNEMSYYLKDLYNWNELITKHKVLYLPNCYPKEYKTKRHDCHRFIDISCFGAIRPLKNQLEQAYAAIKFATSIGKKLRFHINVGRIEHKGEAVLKNLEHLFENSYDYFLIKHEWMTRDEFLHTCSLMDIGMQASFSETFNIICADHVSQGVPVIGSKEIPWLDEKYICSPTDSEDIYKKLLLTYHNMKANVRRNRKSLDEYTTKSLIA